MNDLGRFVMIYRGAYDANFSYEILDCVHHENAVYLCINPALGKTPATEASYWLMMSTSAATADQIAAQQSAAEAAASATAAAASKADAQTAQTSASGSATGAADAATAAAGSAAAAAQSASQAEAAASGMNIIAASIPLADAGAAFDTDNVEAALQQLGVAARLSQDGRKIKVLAGVLRYSVGTSGWSFISDETHEPLNVSYVTTESNRVNLYYGFTAKKVLSLVAVPDEFFAKQGFFCGASAGTQNASIYFQQAQTIGGYIAYSGGWVLTGAPGFNAASFNAGVLTITHDPIGSGYQLTAVGRGNTRVSVEAVTPTTLQLSWYDAAGALMTALSTAMRAYVTRTRGMGTYIDPTTMQTNLGNIWVMGVFEVE